jgi:Fe-S-cluster containining protein
MDSHFSCTQCGRCCRNLKLPLTVAEAIGWLTEGNDVQLICEAIPWPEEPLADDQRAAHRRRRSFAAMSGSLPTRVIVVLAANFAGACPHLQADMRCGIYERRPLVCRIYPAEINPFIQMDPAKKACPPEAWMGNQPLFQRDGRVIDDLVRKSIQQSRDTDAFDVAAKRRLCAALNLNCASLADEGYVVYSPGLDVLLTALSRSVSHVDRETDHTDWRFISNRSDTIAFLASRGGVGSLVCDGEKRPYEYLACKLPLAAVVKS